MVEEPESETLTNGHLTEDNLTEKAENGHVSSKISQDERDSLHDIIDTMGTMSFIELRETVVNQIRLSDQSQIEQNLKHSNPDLEIVDIVRIVRFFSTNGSMDKKVSDLNSEESDENLEVPPKKRKLHSPISFVAKKPRINGSNEVVTNEPSHQVDSNENDRNNINATSLNGQEASNEKNDVTPKKVHSTRNSKKNLDQTKSQVPSSPRITPNKKSIPSSVKKRLRPNPFKLVPCEDYGEITEPPFDLHLSIEALAIMDVHAHCIQTEVIGLLGGLFCSKYRRLNVLTAEPCESLTASTSDLQCEMDPVSQADASERLCRSGYQVVGWYHSHPTFVPNPSLRDLETQAKFQEFFAEGNKPFLAIILNPYAANLNSAKASMASNYKCLMIDNLHQAESQTPYAFSPHLIRKEKLFFNLTTRLKELCEKIEGKPSTLCMTDKLKGKELRFIQKVGLSLKHHLNKTGLSDKESDFIIGNIKEILMTHLREKSAGE